MIEFIEFCLSTIGLTFIITQFYIFKFFREWICKKCAFIGKIFTCTACNGFWSGLLIKTILILYYHSFIMIDLLIIIPYGFIGSIICYITYLLIKPLMIKYDLK